MKVITKALLGAGALAGLNLCLIHSRFLLPIPHANIQRSATTAPNRIKR